MGRIFANLLNSTEHLKRSKFNEFPPPQESLPDFKPERMHVFSEISPTAFSETSFQPMHSKILDKLYIYILRNKSSYRNYVICRRCFSHFLEDTVVFPDVANTWDPIFTFSNSAQKKIIFFKKCHQYFLQHFQCLCQFAMIMPVYLFYIHNKCSSQTIFQGINNIIPYTVKLIIIFLWGYHGTKQTVGWLTYKRRHETNNLSNSRICFQIFLKKILFFNQVLCFRLESWLFYSVCLLWALSSGLKN